MMNAPVLLSVSIFVSMVLLFAGMFSYYGVRKRRKQVVDRIKVAEENLIIDKTKEHDSLVQGRRESFFEQFIGSLGRRIKPVDTEHVSGLRVSLLQAGYRWHNAVFAFFGYRIFFTALFPSVFFLTRVFFIGTVQPRSMMTIVLLLAVAGYFLPNLWLRIKINNRQEKILEGFPDALDLMVVCVEAGMGLDAAISRVGEEMKLRNAVISEEFRIMGLELRAGKLRRDALRNLGIRTGMDEVKSLMTLLIQTDKFGTSIAQALRVHSDSMRTRRYQKAEELAAKLPVKLVFPLILFILPSLFVVVVGPAVIRVFRVLLPALGGR
jgi:tight adherence protein C